MYSDYIVAELEKKYAMAETASVSRIADSNRLVILEGSRTTPSSPLALTTGLLNHIAQGHTLGSSDTCLLKWWITDLFPC